MTDTGLRAGVLALEEEIGRLELLKRQIGGVTAGDGVPPHVAQAGERLNCTLEIALRALERDTAHLMSIAQSPAIG